VGGRLEQQQQCRLFMLKTMSQKSEPKTVGGRNKKERKDSISA